MIVQEIPTSHTETCFCVRACKRCEVKMTRRSAQLRAAVIADGFGQRGSLAWRIAYADALGES